MSSFSKIQEWLTDSRFTRHLPKLDPITGLSVITIDEIFALHLMADPSPEKDSADSFFLFVPLASAKNISNTVLENMFWYMAEQNMLNALPAGFRLGADRDSGYFWLVGRFSSVDLGFDEFKQILVNCVESMRKQRPRLVEILATDANFKSNQINEMSDSEILAKAMLSNSNIIWA